MHYKVRTITLATFAAFSVVSFAQTKPTGFMVSGGLYYPFSKTTRDATTVTGFNLALEYMPMTVGNGQPSLQLGFSRLGNGGDRIESRSVFIMNRVPFKNSSESNAYYGYGLGVSFNDTRKTVFVGGGGSSGGGSGNGSGSFVVMSSKNTRLGVQLLVGSKLSQSACVELGVRFVGEADGLPLSGATLSFGVKF